MEAKIDNTTIAITKQLFVFMQKIYGRVQSIAMRHPEDFPLLPKDGLEFPHSREEAPRSTASARAHSVKKIKEARVKSEVTIEYCTV
ncbi:MAG: hypothetical protein DMF15_13190 [Verrucomicrobia bacterium]|nr:MAG: hypothetical protein DMF15_13190 [Verrucomicrobiota bacterium]